MFQWLRRLTAANVQTEGVEELERSDDPRGGFQSDAYRHAQPDELVEEGGTVMSGPGGTQQDPER